MTMEKEGPEGRAAEPDLRAALREGKAALQAGRLAEAAARVEPALAAHPDVLGLIDLAARIAAASKNHDRAIALHERAAALAPDRLAAHSELAKLYRRVGRLEASDAALTRILVQEPGRVSALVGLADNARRRGDACAAARLLGEAVAQEPGDGALRQQYVGALRRVGEAADIMAAATALARDFPDDVEALVLAADVAQATGRGAEAMPWLDHAAALAPVGISAVSLASALARGGHKEHAVSVLSRAEAAVADADVAAALANLLVDLDDVPAARQAYERAVAADPGRASTWAGLASLTARTASAAEARAVIARARRACGPSATLALAEFDILRHIGLDRAAEGALLEACELAPDDVRLQGRSATFALDHGRFDAVEAAVAAMETRTVRQQVAAAMAAGRLAEARWQLGEALTAFERAIALDPEEGSAHSAVARVLVGLLRPLEARRHLSIAKQLSREDQLSRGRSLNPSQSLVGQLMSECWSNQAAMQLGQSAIEADTLAAFLALVAEEPDYTPGCIAFLVHLRQQGLLAVQSPPTDAPAMPRRVLQFWDTDVLADDVVELMASWRELNPGWEYVRHTDRSARAYLESLPDPRLRRAYRAARKPAQKADLLRLVLLFHEGGVYADADDRCTASLDPHVAGRAVVAAQEGRGSIGNNFLAAVPGHPLIGAALELAVTAMLRGDADTIWLSTGPGLLTRAFAAHLAASEEARAELGRSLVVLERFELRRFSSPACKVSYKTTTRHWSKTEFGQAV